MKFPHVTPSIHADLKKRVSEYFASRKIATYGNLKLYTKALILVVLMLSCYISLVFFVTATLPSVLLAIALGFIIASIGFNIMHDGSHGSFSKNKKINMVAAGTLDLLGGSSIMWNMKHNILHHTYTNIEGSDDDINITPWMRMSDEQRRYAMHKYQHYYFWIFYSLLYLFWVFVSDYKKIFTKQIGNVPLKKMKVRDYIYLFTFKFLNLIFFVVIPIYVKGLSVFLVGYAIIAVVSGLVLSIVFQLAHTVEHTHFPASQDPSGFYEDEWAKHQIKTTANFGTKSKALSWFAGGLNYQIEHHLFPKISHIHYPAISYIIKDVCKDWNISYIEYSNMWKAFVSHLLFLKKMGRAEMHSVLSH